MAWRDGGAGGWNTLSIEVKKRGRVKVSGTLSDGTRVTSSSILQIYNNGTSEANADRSKLLLGEKECAIAVTWSKKKNSASLLLWLYEDDTVECVGLPEGATALAAPLRKDAGFKPGATFRVDAEALAAIMPGLQTGLLPDGMDLQGAKQGKAALKLRHKAMDGSFNGTFKAYVPENGKLRAKTVNVAGVVIDGVGYGTASIRKRGSVPVTVE